MHRQIALDHYGNICPVDTPDKEPGQTLRLVPTTHLDDFGRFVDANFFVNFEKDKVFEIKKREYGIQEVPEVTFEDDDLLTLV
jgi:DNA-directed RNA polymerase beta subunit